MKTIILMRHSNASSSNSALSDRERPLTSSGRTLATTTSGLLLEVARPDRILCSSAVRTQQTADIVATTMGSGPTPEAFDTLYLAPAAGYPMIAAEELHSTDDTVLFVGHNPGIAQLICSWASDSLAIFPATVAIFRVNVDDWADITDASVFAPELTGFISEGARVK